MNGRKSETSPKVLLVPAEDAWQGEPQATGAVELVLARPWLIVATAALFALLAAAITPLLPPTYRSEALVSVASDAEGGLKGISSGQIGSLASLAGIELGGDAKKGEYVAHLRSKVTVRQLIREENLLPVLFRRRWDAEANAWKKTLFHPRVPSIDDGTRSFTEDILSVSEDRKSGLVTIAVEWSDPTLAAKWANRLVEIANTRLRESAIAENSRRTEFLQRELDKTSAVETRQVIYRLQEQTLNRIMVANTQPQYALRIIDPAEPPDLHHPDSPKMVRMVAAGVFAGALAGAFIAIFLGRRRSSVAAKPPAP
jgi:uncharacterized protein involved in exopolysaccharide biosynthesis